MQENTSYTPRRWQRQPSNIPISLVLEADPSKADDSAMTVDISQHGAKVRTKLALVTGERVGVVLKGGFPDAIPARVVWVREQESDHWTFAGLEFLNTFGARK